MSLGFYMDEHVPSAIAGGLRDRGVDVLTAQEDGRDGDRDPQLLDRAAELKRLVFTRDRDFLIEASHRQRQGIRFAGIIYAHQLRVSIGRCIEDLQAIAEVGDEDEFDNQVTHLPLGGA